MPLHYKFVQQLIVNLHNRTTVLRWYFFNSSHGSAKIEITAQPQKDPQ